MSKKVTEVYGELMHYTTGAGLAGMVSSGCVWATHAAFLNDVAEVNLFFEERLPEIVGEAVGSYFVESASASDMASQVKMGGELQSLVQERTRAAVTSIANATKKFNEPHFFSLSRAENEKVRENGLLSQWRGYGRDGGYAVVLDTGEFEKRLEDEVAAHNYMHVQWGDVYYYGSHVVDQPASEDVYDAEERLKKGIIRMLEAREEIDLSDIYRSATTLSCLYKHWGFSEECELRVIAIPMHPEIPRAEGSGRIDKPTKFFLRDGLLVPYIELFQGPGLADGRRRLPIKRVIVGPHKDGASRRQSVELLLRKNGYDCPAVNSRIPFVGR